MDAQALYDFAVNMINDYFKGNNICDEKIKDFDKKLELYFIEYEKKYNDKPETSWLAYVLDQDQFFYYGNYTNVNEFLGELKTERGL